MKKKREISLEFLDFASFVFSSEDQRKIQENIVVCYLNEPVEKYIYIQSQSTPVHDIW